MGTVIKKTRHDIMASLIIGKIELVRKSSADDDLRARMKAASRLAMEARISAARSGRN